jgi:hypothetical protein
MDQRHTLDQDQSSMLKVICSQRDRFRTRLRETEEVCFYLILVQYAHFLFLSILHYFHQILYFNMMVDMIEFFTFNRKYGS